MKKRILLAGLLKQKRREADLKQGEVAEFLGYSTSQFISNWERGISNPPVYVLKKLAKLYKIPLQDIYKILLDTMEADLKRELFSPESAGKRRKFM